VQSSQFFFESANVQKPNNVCTNAVTPYKSGGFKCFTHLVYLSLFFRFELFMFQQVAPLLQTILHKEYLILRPSANPFIMGCYRICV